MSRLLNAGKGQVKVTIIDTHFIQTDARSFKSVVQSLTGKDSTVTSPSPSSPSVNAGIRSNRAVEASPVTGSSPLMLQAAASTADVHFEELQRILFELPNNLGEFSPPLAVEDYDYYS